MKTAEDFAKEYYQLDKSGVTSVSIKSAIYFAEAYAERAIDRCAETASVKGVHRNNRTYWEVSKESITCVKSELK